MNSVDTCNCNLHNYSYFVYSYCTNIHMYLLLKASKINIKCHPIAKRLYQYRQLLSQMEPVFTDTVKPLIENLLQENVNIN